jgi:aryl-phospho-beta-D-glucosidase BglC (GH1 family)
MCFQSASAQDTIDLRTNFLKTSGNKICKNMGAGATVALRGVNIGSWLIRETWVDPVNGEKDAGGNYVANPADASRKISCDLAARDSLAKRFGKDSADALYKVFQDNWIQDYDWQLMKAEGYNCVRLPIFYLILMNKDGTWRKDSTGKIDFSRLDWAVKQAARNGMYTLLDLHGAPGSQNGNMHSGDIQGKPFPFYSTAANQTKALTWWTEVARHFKGVSAVAGYDILNEPSENYSSNMGSQTVDFYKKAYTAIRAVDTDHILFFEGIWSLSTMAAPSTYVWQNVVYELHHYEWTNQDGPGQIASWNTKLAEVATSSSWNVPIVFGELQFFGDTVAWRTVLSTLNSSGYGWMMWSWKNKNTGWSWGIYTAKTPDIYHPYILTDSYAKIKTQWSCWTTKDYFTRNAPYADELKKLCAGILKCDTVVALPTQAASLQSSGTSGSLSIANVRIDRRRMYTVALSASMDKPFSLELFDSRGIRMQELFQGMARQTSQSVSGSLDRMIAPGSYLVRLSSDGVNLSRMVSVIR